MDKSNHLSTSIESHHYDPRRWNRARRFLRFLLRTLGRLFLKVDKTEGMELVPVEGPGIMMINHIGWIDPIAVIRVSQRMVVPMGKEEAWHYPIIGLIPRVWGAIPVRRGDVDPKTLRLAMNVLRAGEIVLVAPEGTRSPQLQEGLEGIAFLASRADVPIIPVALDHTEGFPSWPISPRWQEPGAHIRFGRPFRYHRALKRAKRAQLRAMTDEAMFVLAGLLPEWRRGVYGDISNATQETIEWL